MRHFLLLMCALSVWGQTLEGVIIDASGAVLPGARVTITLEVRTLATASGEDGRFGFSGLNEGQYQIRVAAPGFSPYSSLLRIRAGEPATLPAIMLEVAEPCWSSQPTVPLYRVQRILGETAEITGRVIPPQHIDVEIKTIVGVDVLTAHTTSDKRGEFHFSQLTPGRHRLYLTPEAGFYRINPMDVISHSGELLIIEPIHFVRVPPPDPRQKIVVCE